MKKVILVTGASSGIGLATASLLHKKGHTVYGVSRNIRQEDVPFTGLKMDVANAGEVAAVIAEIVNREHRIDVLINSAGFGMAGAVEEMAIESMKAQFEVNFFGLLQVTQPVIGLMRKQGSGLIINISSIGGLMGLPFQGIYSASKFALEGLSEALRMELYPYHIEVKLIIPGDINTSFTSNRKIAPGILADDPYTGQFKTSLAQIEKDEKNGVSPERVAVKIERIIRKRKSRFRHIVSIPLQRLAVTLKRILPYNRFEKMMKQHYKLTK